MKSPRHSDFDGSIWISAADSPVRSPDEDPYAGKREPEDGTAWFERTVRNGKPVAGAFWNMTGLGVFRAFANGAEVGADDFLKPGYTHFAKTRHAFRYDITRLIRTGAGEENRFGAYVSSGWWRDRVVLFRGKRSAFRAVLVLRHPDGTETRVGTDATWLASGAAGPVLRAGIYDGEDYDARLAPSWRESLATKNTKRHKVLADSASLRLRVGKSFSPAVENTEFSGAIVPMEGPCVALRHDLAMPPVAAYAWRGVTGADAGHFGTVVKTKSIDCSRLQSIAIIPGETLVIDFGQNCAAVPEFVFSAQRGTTLSARPAELLNDGNGAKSRGCDGPEGSAHFSNYLGARSLLRYTFAGDGEERHRPSFTYFGGRYLSITADGPVELRSVRWIPVSSIHADAETASLETGVPELNRLISNILWSQRSNYLSIPTDCPQRAERLGWTADTQVFAKAACYNADVRDFLRKWMRDMRDSQNPDGGFPGVAPPGRVGANEHQFGWADAGVIVPYTVWRHFGDRRIVEENWDAMERYVALVDNMKFASPQALEHQWADWLSFEALETCSGRAYVGGVKNVPPVKPDALLLWRYLGCCHWLMDARMMAEMALASAPQASPCVAPAPPISWRGATAPRKYSDMATRALAYIRENFVDPADGLLLRPFRGMQTPALFALRLRLLDPAPAHATRDALLENIRAHGCRLQTGFLGTSMILDVLSDEAAAPDLAYSLLLQRECPSWLSPVVQGATTVWERWDAYSRERGLHPGAGGNSLNHYAYGAVFAWMMSHMAGIREDPGNPGFRHFILAPLPDRRVGHVTARHRSPCGEIESAWRYGDGGATWTWRFTIPRGTSATVIAPGLPPREFGPGIHAISTKGQTSY